MELSLSALWRRGVSAFHGYSCLLSLVCAPPFIPSPTLRCFHSRHPDYRLRAPLWLPVSSFSRAAHCHICQFCLHQPGLICALPCAVRATARFHGGPGDLVPYILELTHLWSLVKSWGEVAWVKGGGELGWMYLIIFYIWKTKKKPFKWYGVKFVIFILDWGVAVHMAEYLLWTAIYSIDTDQNDEIFVEHLIYARHQVFYT